MRLIILGLKIKGNEGHFVYDVTGKGNHTAINLNEIKTIDILSPFPFSNFSSNDEFDENKFEKCYLEVESELSESEFSSMKSSGIRYHRFKNRKVTFLGEYEDIFQYSLKSLNDFGEQLGTYDLLTWVIHNETRNELEFEAMKEIIFKDVSRKENIKYPLDISLDVFTIRYIDYFRELSEKGYQITFGRYGSIDEDLFEDEKVIFSNESFLYIIENVLTHKYSFFKHPNFTPNFYEEYIKGKGIEANLFYNIQSEDIITLKNKGFDIEDLYLNIYNLNIKRYNNEFPQYNGDFVKFFSDPDYEPYIESQSPYDYYCCVDCDGYDILEEYDEDELEDTEYLVDERLEYLERLIGNWGDFLSPTSYPLFDRIPDDILEQFSHNKFFKSLLSFRKDEK